MSFTLKNPSVVGTNKADLLTTKPLKGQKAIHRAKKAPMPNAYCLMSIPFSLCMTFFTVLHYDISLCMTPHYVRIAAVA